MDRFGLVLGLAWYLASVSGYGFSCSFNGLLRFAGSRMRLLFR